MQGGRVANTKTLQVLETFGIRPKLRLSDCGSATAEMPWSLGSVTHQLLSPKLAMERVAKDYGNLCRTGA
jgi:hypothetical protein